MKRMLTSKEKKVLELLYDAYFNFLAVSKTPYNSFRVKMLYLLRGRKKRATKPKV